VRYIAIIALTAVLSAIVFVFLGVDHIYVRNDSDSMNPGYYLRVPIRTLHRGDIVEVCLPPAQRALAVSRKYLAAGPCWGQQALVKEIGALPGDLVTVQAHSVCVNGLKLTGSRRWQRDRFTHAMIPAIPAGNYRIQPGFAWVETPRDSSWDSRYFGPVESRFLIARLLYIGRQPWRLTAAGPCAP